MRELAAESTVLALERGGTLISQHNAAEQVFFLISGSVQSYLRFHGVDDLLVGTIRERGLCSAGRFFASPSLHRDGQMRGGMPGAAATSEVIMKLVETSSASGICCSSASRRSSQTGWNRRATFSSGRSRRVRCRAQAPDEIDQRTPSGIAFFETFARMTSMRSRACCDSQHLRRGGDSARE